MSSRFIERQKMKSSVMSFPNRGKWGNSNWRGNASGHVYKDIFEQIKPQVFVDPMVGSGTSVEVAQEMGIEAHGLDLHQGFNAIRHSILEKVGKESCLVLSHPPYGGMIVYSGNVWGCEAHPDDLSRCIDDNDFHEKMQLVMLNQRTATRPGGYYGTIIGDWRRGGVYTSYQAEIIARLPRDELASVIIKTQHNCVSDARSYGHMALPRIMHEYVLIFQKKAKPVLVLLRQMACEQQARLNGTWKTILQNVLMMMGGKAEMKSIYEKVAENAPERLSLNVHWREKVRQTLNSNPKFFASDERGVWCLA